MVIPALCQGRILWLDVADPQGSVKHRPVVIISPDAEIESAATVAGIVCSTTSAQIRPRPADYIELPHDPSRTCRTKLRKPTVAVCRWTVQLEMDRLTAIDADDYAGVAPPQVVKAIIEAHLRYRGEA